MCYTIVSIFFPRFYELLLCLSINLGYWIHKSKLLIKSVSLLARHCLINKSLYSFDMKCKLPLSKLQKFSYHFTTNTSTINIRNICKCILGASTLYNHMFMFDVFENCFVKSTQQIEWIFDRKDSFSLSDLEYSHSLSWFHLRINIRLVFEKYSGTIIKFQIWITLTFAVSLERISLPWPGYAQVSARICSINLQGSSCEADLLCVDF